MPALERRFRKLALAVSLVALAIAPAEAAEAPPPEAAKAEIVARILEGREFELVGERDPAVCLPLLDALRAGGEAVEFVEPIVRAEYYRDEALLPYRAMCPGMELNKQTQSMGDPIADDISDLPEAEQYYLIEATARHYFGTRNFKLYRVDLDNDPTNGEEYVFYAERYYLRRYRVPLMLRLEEIPRSVDWNDILRPEDVPDGSGYHGLRYVGYYNGRYTVLDFDRCERLASGSISDPYNYVAGHSEDNHNAIIRLQGRHFVLELFEGDQDPLRPTRRNYWVAFNQFNDGYSSRLCSFKESPAKD